jgi:hypothetical protein
MTVVDHFGQRGDVYADMCMFHQSQCTYLHNRTISWSQHVEMPPMAACIAWSPTAANYLPGEDSTKPNGESNAMRLLFFQKKVSRQEGGGTTKGGAIICAPTSRSVRAGGAH